MISKSIARPLRKSEHTVEIIGMTVHERTLTILYAVFKMFDFVNGGEDRQRFVVI